MNTRDLRGLDRLHHLHPFTDARQMQDAGGTRLIVRGEGVHVYTDDGKRLLDGMAGLWCVNVGYGREELVRAAAEQMLELPYYNSFFQCSPAVTVELAAALSTLTP
ncbi:MAG TPA: aminotransferase class III-fold pyridoxal phosphate-dependent enzyme, partial [Burkholderiales bacterium]|nr:aminotransferase class III-fold pyridoxal phosphate-dependent enzyme [Burkholderiales bacterium]